MTIHAVKEKAIHHVDSYNPLTTVSKKLMGLTGFFRSMFDPPSENMEPKWTNWAKNQSCEPSKIFHPETLQDLIAIVLKAKASGKKIRCAGTGHTWSSSSVTDGYLVDVKGMKQIHTPVYDGTHKSWTVTVESGVLVKDLDDALRYHDPPLAIASNVVLDSVRYGGILALGCHGAATQTRTLPDLVTEVTIIDANGNLNTFSEAKDPKEFAAATVNLGLLGVIYTYTIRIEPMFNLLMIDRFPPLSDYFSTPEEGGPKLKALVLGNDSTEIFYWPFNSAGFEATNDHLWVKQWRRTTDPVCKSAEYGESRKQTQVYKSLLSGQLFNFMAANPAIAPYMNWVIFVVKSRNDADEVMEVPDAIHYQAGIDNMPCVNLEMAFKVNEDFSNVVVAWNYVIDQMYEYARRGVFPFNLPIEMRFVKSSSMLMSNAYDPDPDAIYCTVEILSANNTPGFKEFTSKMAKFWMDNFQARPHWAKMWEHVPGIVPYLRRQAGERYDRFEGIRKKYDPNGMFMNATFAGLLGH